MATIWDRSSKASLQTEGEVCDATKEEVYWHWGAVTRYSCRTTAERQLKRTRWGQLRVYWFVL